MAERADDRLQIEFCGPCLYRLVVRGRLDPEHARRLGSFQIMEGPVTPATETETTLLGRLRDQTELNGVLQSIHDLHLVILSLEAVDEGESATGDPSPAERARS